ncbi:MAG TPA: class I SAM-dependent methyltransferase [Dehalococcoidia bacterium]|nr:class I SAM-dependent methyltransferase [Dehalococcoidia bacterium]
MERAEWLKDMRDKAEKLYDIYSPRYWSEFGLYPNETHLEYLQKFLDRIPPRSTVLSAGCGAGRYDGILLEAGHSVVGIDQSAGMLAQAREHFPEVRYEKIGLQEMDFQNEFDGVTCIDALEHVFPEEWPGIAHGFREALNPDGVLYFTVDLGGDHLEEAYERAKAMGLPVVFGEVVDEVEEAYERAVTSGEKAEAEDVAVYHYHPSLEQVRTWISQEGLVIEEEGIGNWYEHFIMRKK